MKSQIGAGILQSFLAVRSEGFIAVIKFVSSMLRLGSPNTEEEDKPRERRTNGFHGGDRNALPES